MMTKWLIGEYGSRTRNHRIDDDDDDDDDYNDDDDDDGCDDDYDDDGGGGGGDHDDGMMMVVMMMMMAMAMMMVMVTVMVMMMMMVMVMVDFFAATSRNHRCTWRRTSWDKPGRRALCRVSSPLQSRARRASNVPMGLPWAKVVPDLAPLNAFQRLLTARPHILQCASRLHPFSLFNL